MEIIVEILLQVLLWILQFIGELLLQAFGQLLIEVLGHVVMHPGRRTPPPPWLAVIGYALLGAAVGAISLHLLPALLVAPWLRVANVVLTPVASGLLMMLVGSWRRKRGQALLQLDSLACGYCFALAMALVRFFFAH